jgi:hypothetical protein
VERDVLAVRDVTALELRLGADVHDSYVRVRFEQLLDLLGGDFGVHRVRVGRLRE